MVARIMARYPNWIGGLSLVEQKLTAGEWASDLLEFAAQDVHYLWRLVQEAMKANPGAFPPGITEITAYIRRAIWAEAKRLEQNQESRLLADERGKERSAPTPEFLEMMEKLSENVSKYNKPLVGPSGKPIKYMEDDTPLRAEDFPKKT